MNPNKIKKDFPIFKEKPELVYLDNAATSQKPKTVIKQVKRFYETDNSNVGRGIYQLASNATQNYEKARETTANFINADQDEIIFVRNTTEAQNLLASSLEFEGDVVLSEMAHHSEQLPWRETNRTIKYLETKKGKISVKDAEDKIDSNTGIVAISHISNIFGVENPVNEIAKIARENDALVVLDCAQSVPHRKIDINRLDIDFLTFSGHKMLGPTGIGVLYGRKDHLADLKPYQVGGGMVSTVKKSRIDYKEPPHKFEAGTPNIAGAIGLKAAINYLQQQKMDEVYQHTKKISNQIRRSLRSKNDIEIISPEEATMVSFKIDDIHAHDVAEILGQDNIAVRAGNHCAQPQHAELGLTSTTRISPYIYNSEEDVKKLSKSLDKVLQIFNV